LERLYTILGMYAEQIEILKSQLREAQAQIEKLQAQTENAKKEPEKNDA